MEIKLKVYETRALKKVDKTYSVSDFKLSLGACEDVLNLINIDMFEGGLDALSDESKSTEMMKLVVNSFPTFKDILKDIFDGLTDEEIGKTDIEEIVVVVINIVKYAFGKLTTSIGKKKN